MPSRSRRSGPPGRKEEGTAADNPPPSLPPRAALDAWGRTGSREERWQATGWGIGICLAVLTGIFIIYYGITLALAAVFDLDPVGLSFVTYALVMAPLFVLGAWLLAHSAGQGRHELGLNGMPANRLLGWGAAGGLAGLFANYAFFLLVYLIVLLITGERLSSPDAEALRSLGGGYQLVAVFATACLAPFCEEVFFRGALYSTMRKSLGRNRALMLNALVFALLHLKWQGLLSLFALGLVFAWLYEETDSVYPGILAHAINNIVVLLVIYLT